MKNIIKQFNLKKNILLLAISLFFCANIFAQLKLIPTPQHLEIKNSGFEINHKTQVVVQDLNPFYLNQLLDCVKEDLKIDLKITKRAKSNYIEFIKISSQAEFAKLLKENNLEFNSKSAAEGYFLKITPKTMQVFAQTDAGIFYGLQTLKQIISANRKENTIPSLLIYDFPNIAVRAWQDDISRGPIPTMEKLKEQIKKLSSYKLNHFTLYIEHVYKLENHPEIAPKDGISKDEIAELSSFAEKHHIRLIASYQSFGHMEKTLSLAKYKHMAENEHIISPALEESYTFLNEVYQEIVPAFSGEYFNINCDETFGLGEGKSKKMMDTMGIDGIYLYHVNRLNVLLKKYDKKILMWGDIVAKYPHIISQLPEDITVISWGYHEAENFDYAITPLSNTGINFWVAPGVNCWSTIFPDYHTSEINIFNLIRDGYKHKTTGVLNTTWDDDGLNFFQNNWHGLIWGAEVSWKTPSINLSTELSNAERKSRYSAFNEAYNELFFGLKDDNINDNIIEFSNLKYAGVRDIMTNTRFFEPVFPIHLEYISDKSRDANIKLLNRLDSLSSKMETLSQKVLKNKETLDYVQFAIQQLQFSLHKNLLRIDLYHFINKNKDISDSELRNKIKILILEIEHLKTRYSVLWNRENKKHWLDVNMKKFDGLMDELNNLEGYCVIVPSEHLSEKGRAITMRSLFGDFPVYYSINQEKVGRFSTKYTDTIYVHEDVSIKACAVNNDKTFGVSECNLVHHKAIGKLLDLHSKFSTYHPSYDGGGMNALLDGKEGDSLDLRSGKWQGFGGRDIEIEIDLENIETLHSFSMGFFQNTYDWVIFPKQVEIYVKDELNKDYQLFTTIKGKIPPEKQGNLKDVYFADFKNIKTRYIKVIARYYGKLPEWHHAGSNYESMIFSDEIIIK